MRYRSCCRPHTPTSYSSSVGTVRQEEIIVASQFIPQTVVLVKNVLIHIETLCCHIFAHTSQYPDGHTLLYPVARFSCPRFCPYGLPSQGETGVNPNKGIRRTCCEKSFVCKALEDLIEYLRQAITDHIIVVFKLVFMQMQV